MAKLEVKGLSKRFGGLHAVRQLNFRVDDGEIVGLIGPNGAGKTTVFNMISGALPPTSGDVWLDGRRVTGMKPQQLVRLGLGRTFQLTKLFMDQTVLRNVMNAELRDVGLRSHANSVLRTRRAQREVAEVEAQSLALLDLVGIAGVPERLAGELPHGHQRLLEIAIALATGPRLLLLDEPVTGMNLQEAQATMEVVRKVREQLGVTILLIEHDMKVVMGLCERIIVMDFGEAIAEGSPAEVCRDECVIAAYLGVADLA